MAGAASGEAGDHGTEKQDGKRAEVPVPETDDGYCESACQARQEEIFAPEAEASLRDDECADSFHRLDGDRHAVVKSPDDLKYAEPDEHHRQGEVSQDCDGHDERSPIAIPDTGTASSMGLPIRRLRVFKFP